MTSSPIGVNPFYDEWKCLKPPLKEYGTLMLPGSFAKIQEDFTAKLIQFSSVAQLCPTIKTMQNLRFILSHHSNCVN